MMSHQPLSSSMFLFLLLLPLVTSIPAPRFKGDRHGSQHNFEITKTLRRLQVDPNTNETVEQVIHQMGLDGSVEFGYYYASLFVGTPPQKQTVIVDTGSDITAFPCDGNGVPEKIQHCNQIFIFTLECHDCGRHFNTYFEATHSNTTRDVQCDERVGNYNCMNCNANDRCLFSIVKQSCPLCS